jgi:hypothetical protein
MCGESSFDNEYSQFVPRPFAFRRENEPAGVGECQCKTSSQGSSCGGVTRVPQAVQQPRSEADFEKLVQTITNQGLGALGGSYEVQLKKVRLGWGKPTRNSAQFFKAQKPVVIPILLELPHGP